MDVTYDNRTIVINSSLSQINPENADGHLSLKLIVVIALSALPLLTIVGNSLVVYAVITKAFLHTPGGFFILSLAVSDLIAGTCVMPFSVSVQITPNHQWQFGLVFCDILHCLEVLARTASIWNLCVISLDRFIAIRSPLRYRDIVSLKKACGAVGTVWLGSAVASFPAVAWWRAQSPENYVNPEYCIFTSDPAYIIFSSVVSFYLPAVIIIFAYSYVYIIASRHGKSVQGGRRKLSNKSLTKGPSLYIRIHRGGTSSKRSTISKSCKLPGETSCLLSASPTPSRCSKNACTTETPRNQKLSSSRRISYILGDGDSPIAPQQHEDSPTPSQGVSPTPSLHWPDTPMSSQQWTLATQSSHKTPEQNTQKCSTTSDPFSSEEDPEIQVIESSFIESKDRSRKFCFHSKSSWKNIPFKQESEEHPRHKSETGQLLGVQQEKRWTCDETSIRSARLSQKPRLLASLAHRRVTMSAENLQGRLKEFFADSASAVMPEGMRQKQQKIKLFWKFMREKRAAKTIGIVVGCFLACWLPFFVINIITVICPTAIPDPDWVFTFVTWLGHCNSMLNPLIYSLSNREFRRAFKQILCYKREKYSTRKGMVCATQNLIRVAAAQSGYNACLDNMFQD